MLLIKLKALDIFDVHSPKSGDLYRDFLKFKLGTKCFVLINTTHFIGKFIIYVIILCERGDRFGKHSESLF